MDSPVNFEIVEAKAEKTPPIWKKGYKKALEDDINKLFESINLRTSKSLDFFDMPRNASKRPIRGNNGSHSPGIGFSDPVSLKQALRGLCISQAAEMAAIKRMSLPASPRVSEAGRIGSKYRPVGGQSGSFGEHVKSGSQSLCSSPAFHVKPVNRRESGHHTIADCNDVGIHVKGAKEQTLDRSKESGVMVNGIDPLGETDNKDDGDCSKEDREVSGSDMGTSTPNEDCVTSLRLVDKAVPKVRRKSRLQMGSSSGVAAKGNKDLILMKSTSCAPKPVRNKNLIVKKSKKAVKLADGNLKLSDVLNSGEEEDSGKLICQRCQCSLKDTNNEPSQDYPVDNRDCNGNKPDAVSSLKVGENIAAVKSKKASKTCEKGGDISQSSQSSLCDFSSSTASLSDESNLSGSGCGNRPHMSKDARWEAINRVRKQYGFLGLSHFNLLKKLGSGDIGSVYLAELIGMRCLFAIKVMDNEFLERRKKMPRAHTELEILKTLDHPFLPTLYAQFTSDNLSCLVMEFCPGGDLHVLRQKQPGRCFPEQAARFYLAEVLLALEYLHMLGIVYRDLKPENILVREDGHIMLTDFDLSLRCSVCPTLVQSSHGMEPPRVSGPCAGGSNCIDPFCTGPSCKMSCFSPRFLPPKSRARKLKADAAAQARLLPQLIAEPTEARSNSFVGTHEYLAPEIVKGDGHGSAVDWWTLGVFLFELLYGKTPFRGAGNEETLTNVVLQNLKFPDSPIVSFQARDLIRSLLVKEPEIRLGTETGAAEIKRHPFFEGLNWALIRCAIPPQIPELYDGESSQITAQGKGIDHTREHLYEIF